MKRFLPLLIILLLPLPCYGQDLARMNSYVLGAGVVAGPAPGTILLGTSDTTGSADNATLNINYMYYMTMVGQETATVAKAYYYDRTGFGATYPVKVCIFTDTGSLLGCSGDISGAAAGWENVNWSGPSIVKDTTYLIGVIAKNNAGWTYWDTTSPTYPTGSPLPAMTYDSETNITTPNTSGVAGSILIYVTN